MVSDSNFHFPRSLQILDEERKKNTRALPSHLKYRHRQIFPDGFDQDGKSPKHLPYAFAPDQLHQLLTGRYDPDEHVESIVVRSAHFGKERKSAQHEFIMFEVEDTQVTGLINYIILDRNNSDTRAIRVLSNSIVPPHIGAKDEFRVSHNGNQKQLLKACDLDPDSMMEKIEFGNNEPLLFYQVVTLAKIASARRQQYQPVNANCYWFAGLVWDCIGLMRPNAIHSTIEKRLRGVFHKVPLQRDVTDRKELASTYTSIQAELKRIELDFTKSREVSFFLLVETPVVGTN